MFKVGGIGLRTIQGAMEFWYLWTALLLLLVYWLVEPRWLANQLTVRDKLSLGLLPVDDGV